VNDPAFAAAMARLGDVYCNDAFSAAHRAHASTEGLARLLPSCAGLLMAEELSALDRALGNPQRPVVAIVGGAKVSTKLDLLDNLVAKVDHLVIGGAMANTFLHAQGYPVGHSLHEPDLAENARAILARAEETGCEIVLPRDVVVAKELKAGATESFVSAHECPDDVMILDVGPQTVSYIDTVLHHAKTLIWNGPSAPSRPSPSTPGTHAVARKVADLTRRAPRLGRGRRRHGRRAQRHGRAGALTYVSSAGGAFLEWMEARRSRGRRARGDPPLTAAIPLPRPSPP
jgi:phosphoglycerate kinase